MLKRLLAVLLAGGLMSACGKSNWSASSIWQETKSTVSDAADSLTKPDSESGADTPEALAARAAGEHLAVPKNKEDCIARGKAHQAIESTNIRVTGTVVGEGKASVAMVNDGSHPDEVVRIGEYIGTQCWRVREIEHDYLLLEQPYRDAAGTAQARTLQVDFGVKSTAALR
jgi:Tfp pilus assembly protein PilP